MKKIFKNLSLSLFASIALLACQQENLNPAQDSAQPNGARTEQAKPSREGDYLVFENYEAFENAARSLSNRPEADRANYENQFAGFVSMRQIFVNAQAEKKKMAKQYDQLPENEQKALKAQLNGKIMHTDYAKQHPHALKLRPEGGVELNVFNHDFASLTNEKGLVKIGKHIYQYTAEAVKVLIDGDSQKIPMLLNASETSKNKNIWVLPIKSQISKGNKGGRTEANNVLLYDEDPYADQKRLTAEVRVYDYVTTPIYDTSNCPPDQFGCLGELVGWNYVTCYNVIAQAQMYSWWYGWEGNQDAFVRVNGNATYEYPTGTIVPLTIYYGLSANFNYSVYGGTKVQFLNGTHTFELFEGTPKSTILLSF